jgi:hypothetical protein
MIAWNGENIELGDIVEIGDARGSTIFGEVMGFETSPQWGVITLVKISTSTIYYRRELNNASDFKRKLTYEDLVQYLLEV